MLALCKSEDPDEFARRKTECEQEKVFDPDTLASVYSAEIPPVQYLIDGLIIEGGVGMLVGKFGSGKSTIVLSMANAIAQGRDWCGLATKQSPVLYLDRENPVAIVRDRLHRMKIRDEGALKIWTSWHKEADIFNHNLDSDVIQNYAIKHPRCLIVIDSFVGFLPQGASENDAMHVREYMNLARKLSALGATTIFLHHSGKGESSKVYRGSTDIPGASDFGLTVEPTVGEKGGLTSIKLDTFKQRVLMSSAGMTFEFDGSEFSNSESDGGLKAPPFYVQLVDLIRENPGRSQNEFEKLATSNGIPRNDARRFIERGKKKGLITALPGAKRSVQLYWHEQQAGTDSE